MEVVGIILASLTLILMISCAYYVYREITRECDPIATQDDASKV